MKYCEQCGTALDDNAEFCSECGVKCGANDNCRTKETQAEICKTKYKSGKKKKIAVCIVIAVLIVFAAGVIDSGGIHQFFSDIKKGSEEAEKKAKENDSKEGEHKKSKNNALTEDGTAYQMTVEEYCGRFNQIAGKSWCSSSEEAMRVEAEKATREAMEEAARTDTDMAEQLMQTMTSEMIPDVTLLKNDAAEELNGSENYVTYTYVNQYSFIPAHIGIQILARRDTDQIVGIAAEFPMDYRNVGEKFGKLICDSYGEESQAGEFQELYNKMKEAGGYGHSYKDGTVFELMYKEGSDTTALFKMSACTEEHYEEAWLDNPDLPSKENPIKNSEENKILELFDNLTFYEGTWGDFGVHVDKYQGMVESAIKNSISLSDYFGDVNGTYMILEKGVSNDDVLENGPSATNQFYWITFEGPSVTGTGGARYLDCMVSSPDGVNLVYEEILYY